MNATEQKHVWYPKNEILAAIDEVEEVEVTISDLLDSGVEAENITLFSGEEARQQMDTRADDADWLTKIVRSWWSVLSGEAQELEDYERQLSMGRHVLAVRVAEETDAVKAHEVLKRHPAHHIRHFGSWTIEELPSAD